MLWRAPSESILFHLPIRWDDLRQQLMPDAYDDPVRRTIPLQGCLFVYVR